jgi:hypothetical protein
MRRSRSFLNLILGVAIALAACSNQQAGPVGPQPPLAPAFILSSLTGAQVSLPSCDVLPAASVSGSFDQSGGVLQVGPHTLVIPSGALDGAVTITGSIKPDSINSIHFEPEGLQFRRPALLTMSYANCQIVRPLRRPLRIVYTDDLLSTLLEILPSMDESSSKAVSANLKHFSQYAVAY